MVKIRKFSAYQKLERPYTRVSKFTNKNYVRGGFPHQKITRFEMGDPRKSFELTLHLIGQRSMNIRQNALEAARMSSNRVLESKLGSNYHLKIKVFPFHVLRENPMATGAGADRMSQGMTLSFGKPIGSAARVREGQELIQLRLNKEHLGLGKEALQRAAKKLPCTCKVVVG